MVGSRELEGSTNPSLPPRDSLGRTKRITCSPSLIRRIYKVTPIFEYVRLTNLPYSQLQEFWRPVIYEVWLQSAGTIMAPSPIIFESGPFRYWFSRLDRICQEIRIINVFFRICQEFQTLMDVDEFFTLRLINQRIQNCFQEMVGRDTSSIVPPTKVYAIENYIVAIK